MAESDMIIITYSFLLRPGEYRAPKSDITVFCLKDTTFSCGRSVFVATATEGDLQAANHDPEEWHQEKIGHKVSWDTLFCPNVDLPQQVIHMRSQGAPLYTPIARAMTLAGRWENITCIMISKTLKNAVGFCRPNLGFKAKNMSAQYLSAASAMSLLYSGVDSDIINLILRWPSDKMIMHPHAQA